ncbi:alpha-ketoacid dehydrogenase subunit beta [Desulforhabdus amnigena]|jgi:pyruvate dehydrogenase E1 component beta subunit|uniref:2-oxoisovalerate dehydrogenase subunit beta n=1 Tax=Desulforhabdus amnigena TaxID=40218 RepID=A0A9W6L8B0_9BACT|nr:alpha-ketoacid dehydrogenase subunit beta [Desulforhabdus amnigena]NLJ28106.1 alpha-ketoacid dehydrogenase subunit beta [Deltaproteobacteria bacterium]GLI35503.1 2-oxoisovalerate dehydrogenase subunit beta [Desulforhabdus amnigena]
MAKLTMVQAINLALHQEMEKDDRVIVLGEDVGVDGGVFRVTEGLIEKFGAERVLDTPLAESGIAGFSIGMAVYGLRPVCEMQFSGFSYFAFHQMESHAARLRGRSLGRFTVPMVLRAPYGGGVRALEHHSESREVYFAHTPGLKMVIPSSPRNARSLLISAIRDPDPVVFFEPKALYRAFREEVPEEEETFPIGKSRLAREGKDVTLISYGAMMHPTLEAASRLKEKDGIDAEVIDLLTLSPLDDALFTESARKTGRVVVVHEAPRSFGAGAEVVARLVEKSFLYLEAPIRRVTGFDSIIPLYQREMDYLPGVFRITNAVREVLNF